MEVEFSNREAFNILVALNDYEYRKQWIEHTHSMLDLSGRVDATHICVQFRLRMLNRLAILEEWDA